MQIFIQSVERMSCRTEEESECMRERNQLRVPQGHIPYDILMGPQAAARARIPASSETRGNIRRLATVLFALIGAMGIAAFFNALSMASRLIQTSDTALSLIAGYAVARGNTLLSGWNMASDNYYFTDTVPWAAIESLFGPRPDLLVVVPAVYYALFVVLALLVSVKLPRPGVRNIDSGAIIVLLLACPPWIGRWDPVLYPNVHFATTFGALITLALCARLAAPRAGRSSKSVFVAGLMCVLAAAATVASDPYALIIAFAPGFLILAIELLLRPVRREIGLTMICLLLGSMLGVLLPKMIHLAGGFGSSVNLSTKFVDAPELGSSLSAIVFGLLHLSGAYPFGLAIGSVAAALALIRCVGFVLMLAAVRRAAAHFFRPPGADLLDRMLCVAILLTLASCALSGQYSSQVSGDGLWTGAAAIRYLVPTWLLAAVLAARQIPDAVAALPVPSLRIAVRGLLVLLAALMLIGSEWQFGAIKGPSNWIRNAPPAAAARWLEQHKLNNGVGEYWSAYIITAMSGEAVRVGPVAPQHGRLVPLLWIADKQWYVRPPEFVIWTDKNQAGVTTEQVRATYCSRGCKISSVGQYTIAILAR